MKRIQMTLPEPLYTALMTAKRETGLTMSDILRRAIELWLAQYRNRKS